MRYYLYLILILILFALTGIGFLLYKNFQINRVAFKSNVDKMIDETSDKIFVNNTTDTGLLESNGKKEVYGVISGEICYASESIPPLKLYFENLDTGRVESINTNLNQSDYKLEVTPGTYIAYAYVIGIEESPGGYTEAVECGLTEECEDHTLIEFNVEEDGLASGIDICDWYGAIVPDQPQIENSSNK